MKLTLSIRGYLAILLLLPASLIGALEYYFVSNRFEAKDQELIERSQLIADQLASSAEYGVFANNREFLEKIATDSLREADVSAVLITSGSGEVLAHAGRAVQPTITDTEFVRLDPHSVTISKFIVPQQIALDPFHDNAAEPPKPIGKILISISRLRFEQSKYQLFTASLFIAMLFFGVSALLIHLLMRTISRPISTLSKAVEAIGEGRLSTRLAEDVTPISELNTLSKGVNAMAGKLQQETEMLQERIDQATEALRLKKEAAEQQSHGKSHLLAQASHDLRQPMQAIVFYLDELKRKPLSEPQQKLVSQLAESVNALTQLLNSLLDLSRLEAGAVEPAIKACPLDPILERVRVSFISAAQAKNIRLILRTCPNVSVQSDPMLLERILMNLASNAVRYTQNDGTVLIACRKRAGRIRLEIRDNGPGIEDFYQERIFDEFFSIDGSQHQHSLGLGLSIVERLCRLLGHTLAVRSKSGMGTVFSIEVDVPHGASTLLSVLNAQPEFSQNFESQSLHDYRILLIDDDVAVLDGLARLLGDWGCTVSPYRAFADLSDALQDEPRPNLVLTDYHLEQGKNGLELLSAIRQHFDAPEIPCILISADATEQIEKQASACRAILLQKPVRPGRLKSLLIFLRQNEHENPATSTQDRELI